ncbi:hypothetical protein CY34DRAFT_94222, partial [Suillus luteus UH-Slu-Lm8-n1]
DADGHNSNNKFFKCYVSADGPNLTTTADAQSVWGMLSFIFFKFLFFPILHRILSSCLNVTPITVIIGISPHGKKTLHY